jgi:D-alanyl-D-alanine carboxypeptidase
MFKLVVIAAAVVILSVGSFSYSSVDYQTLETFTMKDGVVADLSAGAWGIVDVETGTLILSDNADMTYPIASVTKIVTAAAVRDVYDVTATTTITWSDIATEGRAGSLVPGDELSLQTLLFPLLLESSNDAAPALDRSTDGLLVLAMNDYVAKRSLHNTTFFDPSGLSEKNISTVRNIASLASSLYNEQPHILDITRLDSYLYQDYGWHNSSPFIAMGGYIGGKHGFTPEANRTVVAYFDETSALGTSYPIAYILLDSDDLVHDISVLREHVRTYGVLE